MTGFHQRNFAYAEKVYLELFVLHSLRKFIKYYCKKFLLLPHFFLGEVVKEEDSEVDLHKIKIESKQGLWLILKVTRKKERKGRGKKYPRTLGSKIQKNHSKGDEEIWVRWQENFRVSDCNVILGYYTDL